MKPDSDSEQFLNDPRFQALLVSCLEQVERGETLDSARLLASHPEFADVLRGFLEDQQSLQRMARRCRASSSGEPGQRDGIEREPGEQAAGEQAGGERAGGERAGGDRNPGERAVAVPPAVAETLDSWPSADGVGVGERVRYIGQYEILEEIARGGMGIVYKARQESLRRVVALKVILSGQFADRTDVERFRREAQAAGSLQHPGIVSVHEVGEHQGYHYFTMDFVQGQSLAEEIREATLPPRRAAELVASLSEAVQYAHAGGTLHRDLKPANVLLDGQGRARITDFGLAKMVGADTAEPHSSLTASGQILGTPSYMSPEQATGRQDLVGPATDVYSLGAILYACLTGRAPFVAETPVDTLLQVARNDPVPPRSLNPAIPRELNTICLKCLARQPQGRYASAQELADDLYRWLAGRPIKARPVGLVQRSWKWCRRHPARAALVVVLLLASLLSTFLWRRAESAFDLAAVRLYVNQVALAEREWQAHNRERAMELLLECEPPQRGWEWRFVSRLCFATPHVDLPTTSQSVQLARFDPTNQLLATGDGQRLRIWEVPTLALLAELPLAARHFEFSPDGQFLVAAVANQVQRIPTAPLRAGRALTGATRTGSGPLDSGQLDSGQLDSSPDRPELAGADLAGPDAAGPELAVPELAGPQLAVSELRGTTLWTGENPVTRLALDARGQFLAVLDQSLRVVVLRMDEGQPVSEFQVPAATLQLTPWIGFLPGTTRLLVSAPYRPESLWDAETGQQVESDAVLRDGRRGDGIVCSISGDGRRIVYSTATFGQENQVQVRDLPTQQTFTIHVNGDVTAAVISPDGSQLAVAANELNLGVEDMPGAQNDLAGLLGGMVLLATKDRPWRGMVHLYDVETQNLTRTLRGHVGNIVPDGLAFRADGAGLVSAGGFRPTRESPEQIGELKVWDLRAASPAVVLRGHAAEVKQVVCSGDGRWIASADQRGSVLLWARSGRLVRTLAAGSEELKGLAFAAGDSQLVTADASHVVWWDLATGTELARLGPPKVERGAEDPADAQDTQDVLRADIMRLSGKGSSSLLACVLRNRTVLIDAATRTLVSELPHPPHEVPSAAAFAPDGRQISFTYYYDLHGELKTFQLPGWTPRLHVESDRIGNPFRTGWGLLDTVFLPDGKRVIGVGNNGPGLVWNASSGRRVMELAGHSSFLWAVACTPDGSRIATGSLDRTIKLWDAASGREMMTLRGHHGAVNDLAFSPDGSRLYSAGSDRTVRIWNADPAFP